MAETNYVLQIYNSTQFRLIHTYDGGENTYSLPPSETQVDGSVVLSGYLVTSLPCAVVSSGWGVGYRLQDVESALADGSINVSSGKCVISDSNGNVLYDLNNRGVVRGLHNPAYACNNGEILTLAYSLVDPSAPTVINLHYNIPRAEKKYDGYPFFCDTNGYFDNANGFPQKVEMYDEDGNFRGWGYQMFYTWAGGAIDPATGNVISGYPQCLLIGRDVGEYAFEFEGRFDPNSEENKPYFNDVDLDEVEISVRFIHPYIAEIKPRELTFELSDIVLNDKVYDCLPLTYSRDVSVTVGGDGFAVYKDENDNWVYEGADFEVWFQEYPTFSKNVNDDGYLLVCSLSDSVTPWTKTIEHPERGNTKLSNYTYVTAHTISEARAYITPATISFTHPTNITKTYDCEEVPFFIINNSGLSGILACDVGNVDIEMSRQSHGVTSIVDVGVYSVSYSYNLRGSASGNYVLDNESDTVTITIEKRCPGITVTQELEIDYEEKVYDGEELHVTEPVVSLTNLASCDVDKIWIEPVVTYTPSTFTKDVGTYKAEVRYYLRYNGAKTSNYIWDGDEECDGMPSTAIVQGVITPLELEGFECPSCIAEEGEENSGECVWAKQTYNGFELQYSITVPDFGFLDGDEVTVSVSVSGSDISKVYDSNNKLVGIKTSSSNVKTYPVTLSYTISGKDAKNYELPDNLSCSGSLVIVCKTIEVPEITGEYVNGNIRLSHKDLDGVIDGDKTKVALLMDYHIEYDTGTTIKITVTPTLTGTQAQNYCMEGQEVPVYISKTGGGGGGGQGGGDDPGGGGGQGGSHGTQTQVKHEKPIIAPLGEGAKWEYGELFSFYNPNTHILTVRVSIPIDYYNKYLVAYYPDYVRVLVSSIGDVQTRITRYSFDGSAYDDSTGGDSYIPSVGVYQTGHTWDRRTEYNQIYWEFDFVVDDTGSHNATYVSERNKLLSNVDLQIYAWAFGNNLTTSDIASATFKMTKTEPLPPEIGDISVFLVDTPTTELNEDEWGYGWESEDTPHTLANALRYAQDNATILFAGSLMENQQEKPVVSSNVVYTLDFAVTIDASKPYKIIRNENNEKEIVVDDTIENWNGVIVGDCDGRLFDIRSITNNPVTLKNIHFKEGFCAINASTPVYVYDCIIENFSSYSIFVQSDFKISRCIFKNCGNATGLRGEGCIDDCLFESNQKVFPVKGHLAKIYNCTIVAPTTHNQYATTGLTYLDYFNCFISGYSIKYSTADTLDETYTFYDRVARNNIILHTNAKPSLDSPILNDNEEDITADCIKTYNEAFGENNEFNNEVYELSGIDNNPTTSDFLYSNYKPRSKSNYTVIDKGDNAYIQSETDLAGNPRVFQSEEDELGRVDIGCYEFIPYSAFPSIHLSAMEIIDVENSNTKIYHNEYIYNGLQNNVFDVVGDDDIVVNTGGMTVYVLSDDYDFDNDGFDWDGVLDLEEVADYYSELAQETYTNIPTAKHNTAIPTNEEYKWGEIRNVMVLIPGYKACYGGVYITITPKTLELFDFSTTFSTE